MNTAETTRLRRVYAEVCQGYSQASLDDQPVYIKHLGTFDQTEIDIVYDEAFEHAKSRSIRTEKERLEFLKARSLWTDKDEVELHQDKTYLETLRKTRSRAGLKLQINQLDKQIREAEEKVGKILGKRERLVGLTAERVADQKVQFEYIRLSFFSDPGLTKPVYSKSDMNNLMDHEANTALFTYLAVIERLTAKAIRTLAIQSYFTNAFYLCGDRLEAFFGKPLVSLTNYQTNLLSYGLYFKNILTNNDIPQEMLNDPDKIEDFAVRSRNVKSIVDKASVSKNGRVGIVGGTTEDFQAMGVKDGTDDMRQIAARQYKTGREGAQDLGVTWT